MTSTDAVLLNITDDIEASIWICSANTNLICTYNN